MGGRVSGGIGITLVLVVLGATVEAHQGRQPGQQPPPGQQQQPAPQANAPKPQGQQQSSAPPQGGWPGALDFVDALRSLQASDSDQPPKTETAQPKASAPAFPPSELDSISSECGVIFVLGPKDVDFRNSSMDRAGVVPALVNTCLGYIERAVPAIENASSGRKLNEAQTRNALLSLSLAYIHLKQWYGSIKWSDVTELDLRVDVTRKFVQATNDLRRELDVHQLYLPAAAELIASASTLQSSIGSTGSTPATNATSGKDTKSASTTPDTSSSQTGSSTSPAAYVVLETKHYGFESAKPVEGSIAGLIGLLPVYTVAPSTSATSPATFASGYQSAFQVAVAGRASFPAGESGELSVKATSGYSVLTANNIVAGQGSDLEVVTPTKAGRFLELSVEASVYREPLVMAHLTKATLDPLLHFEVALRQDTRYQDLSGSFRRPTLRGIYRFSIGSLPVVTSADGSNTVTLAFGVEYESALPDVLVGGGPKVPSGFRVLLRGDIKLLKAITGGGSK